LRVFCGCGISLRTLRSLRGVAASAIHTDTPARALPLRLKDICGMEAAVTNALAEVLPQAKLLRCKIDKEVDFTPFDK